jgi:EAL and modified HD-GYP domain-containing signal transduction protein
MEQCMKLGFSLFQGYYFAKPTIIAGKKLDHSQLALMKLMGLLMSDAETSEIEEVLKAEPGLTVNLLRLTNSVGSGTVVRITSLGHAITVLGRRQLQRWLQLLVFASGNAGGTGNPLLALAATRGRLMELLGVELRPGDHALADQAFMVGIMSLMPALIGLPIAEIVSPLGLPNEVRDALCEGKGLLGALLRIAESSEDGNLDGLRTHLHALPDLSLKALNRAQAQALQWANSISRDAGNN